MIFYKKQEVSTKRVLTSYLFRIEIIGYEL